METKKSTTSAPSTPSSVTPNSTQNSSTAPSEKKTIPFSQTERNYFVNIIKNPITRYLLRMHILKPEDIKPKDLKPAPAPTPVIAVQTVAEKPHARPQCRVTFRISRNVLVKQNKENQAKTIAIILAILLVFASGAAVYFAIS